MIIFSKKNWLNRIAQFSVILLFPGFFFYNYMVVMLNIPPVLGGYFGPVSFICFVFLFLLGWKELFLKVSQLELFFYFLILFIFIISISNFLIGNPKFYHREIFIWSCSGVLFNLLMFGLGKFINFEKVKLNFFFLIIMFLIIIFNIGDSGIFYLKQDAAEDISENLSTYQGLGRSVLVLSLMVSAFYFKRNYFFYISVVVSLIALFLNGARTEFALYFFSIIFLSLIYAIRDLKVLLKTSLFIFLLISIIVSMWSYIPNSRMMQLFDLEVSSSGKARSEFFSYALLEVFSGLDKVIFGSYGSYVTVGGLGAYPHNIFSAWINLGIIGFILYLFLIFLLWLYAIKWYEKRLNLNLYKVYIVFLIYVTLALIFSKDYSYMLLGFTVGIYSQLYYRIKFKNAFR